MNVHAHPAPGFLLSLITNDYFLRVWTWQEIMVARRITIYFHNHSCEWQPFIDTVAYFLMKNRSDWTLARAIGFSQNERARFEMHSRALQLRLRTRRKSASNSWADLAWQLPEILPSACKIYHASEPRDKAYGVLFAWSLITVEGDRNIPFAVDYNKPVLDVYVELASHLLLRPVTYRWYPLCIVNDANRNPSLPSWVPDWQNNESFLQIQTWIRQMHFNIRSKFYMDTDGSSGPISDNKPQYHSAEELASAASFKPEIIDLLRLRIRGRLLNKVREVFIFPSIRSVDYDPDAIYTREMMIERRYGYGPNLSHTIISTTMGDYTREAEAQEMRKDSWLTDQCRILEFWSKYLNTHAPTEQDLDQIYHTVFADDPSPEMRRLRRTKDAPKQLYAYPSPDFDGGRDPWAALDQDEFRRKNAGSRVAKLTRSGLSTTIFGGGLSDSFENLVHRLTLLSIILKHEKDTRGRDFPDESWLDMLTQQLNWRYPSPQYNLGHVWSRVDMNKHQMRNPRALSAEDKELWTRYRQSVNFILETDAHTSIESIFLRKCFEHKDMALIRTGDGSLGLAFKGVQPGDRIAYWSGCFTPMIMRPATRTRQSDGDEELWRLHGPAFVHGLMRPINWGNFSNTTFTVV
jgi:hypothetical protein